MKTIIFYLLLIFFTVGSLGCSQLNFDDFTPSDRLVKSPTSILQPKSSQSKTSKLAESAPPIVIRQLSQNFERSPQVKIITPQADETFSNTSVTVQLKVKDFALFKDEQLGLGPHLHLILDNEPYQAVYSTEEPIVLTDLAPGTHTLRVFASRPWHESFKNEGAYAQTSFNIFTKTEDNNIDPQLPLLTYSRPTGTYTAEPIMLDFYLTNIASQVIANGNGERELQDWRIRVTINGKSFILDQWQPVYLTGFVPGKNWVQLELIDKNGNNIDNAFNNTIRLINYQPNAQDSDTLAKLVTGEISAVKANPLIQQNYYIQPVGEPEVVEPELTSPPEVTKPQIEPSVLPEKTTEEPESVIEEEELTDLSAPKETSNNLAQPAIDDELTVSEEVKTPPAEIQETITATETTTPAVEQPEEVSASESTKTEADRSVAIEEEPPPSEPVPVTEEEKTVSEPVADEETGVAPEVETGENIETPPAEISPSSQPQESKFKLPAWVSDFPAKLKQIAQDLSHLSDRLTTND